MNEKPFGVFISYRRMGARGHAGALAYVLGERFGPQNVFRDVATLRPGEEFMAVIEKAITNADVALCLINEGWTQDRHSDGALRLQDPNDPVLIETYTALARKPVVIPVLLDEAQMPRRDELPEVLQPLANLNAFKLRDESWGKDAAMLLNHLADLKDERGGGKLTGSEIRRRLDANDHPPLWVGRGGGLNGKTFKDDIATGSWRNQEYEIRFGGAMPPKNWFEAKDFLRKILESIDDGD